MLLMDIVEVLIVNVDKGSLDVAQALELPLQRLSDVMRHLQGKVLVHDNVDLDIVLLAGVICSALVRNRQFRKGGNGTHSGIGWQMISPYRPSGYAGRGSQ